MNVRSGGNAFLTANGGVIGTLVNCIEIEIGGYLVVAADATIRAVSINVCGTIFSVGTPVVSRTGGVVIFNNFLFGPLVQSNRGAMNEYLDQAYQFSALVLQYPLLDIAIFFSSLLEDETDEDEDEEDPDDEDNSESEGDEEEPEPGDEDNSESEGDPDAN